MGNWSVSDYAGWWGAIVASLIGIWEVWKWSREGARLRVSATPNMISIAGDGSPPSEKMILVRVVNIGDSPTVLTHLCGYIYPTKWAMRRDKSTHRFVIPNNMAGQNLPVRLEPGSYWSGSLPQVRILAEMAQTGFLRCAVIDSVGGKEISVVLKLDDLEKPDAASK